MTLFGQSKLSTSMLKRRPMEMILATLADALMQMEWWLTRFRPGLPNFLPPFRCIIPILAEHGVVPMAVKNESIYGFILSLLEWKNRVPKALQPETSCHTQFTGSLCEERNPPTPKHV